MFSRVSVGNHIPQSGESRQNATLCIGVAYFVVNTQGRSAGVFTQAAINNPSVRRGGQVLRGITGKKGGSWKGCSQQEEDISNRLRVAPLSPFTSIPKMKSRLALAGARRARGGSHGLKALLLHQDEDLNLLRDEELWVEPLKLQFQLRGATEPHSKAKRRDRRDGWRRAFITL